MFSRFLRKFEYHISLHHSQTMISIVSAYFCLNTIYLYIILKPGYKPFVQVQSLNTIYLYIILKLSAVVIKLALSLNTIYLYIILKLLLCHQRP